MYDLIVIGSGAAGYTAALKARGYGKSVLLVEKSKLGGTCLNVGCIPTKSLLAQSEHLNQLLETDFLNLEGVDFDFYYERMQSNKNSLIEKQTNGVAYLLKTKGVEYLEGFASLETEHSIKVNNQIIEAKNIIVAAGSKVFVPSIEGIENCIFSDDILNADFEKINDLVIIGGGVIGIEIASIFANMNKKVTIIEAQKRLVFNMDKDVSSSIKRLLSAKGVKVILNSPVERVEKNKVILEGKEIEGDTILCAIGRVPNIDKMDPKDLLEKDGKFIKVNKHFKTNMDSVYAVGDCIKSYQLAHYASSCAKFIVETLYEGSSRINIDNVPSCIYSFFEIASVGSLEEEGDLVEKYSMHTNARSIINQENRGFIKLIADKNGYLKGVSIVCSRASDMIMIFVNAINNHKKVEDLIDDIYPHPSFSESILESLENLQLKISKNK